MILLQILDEGSLTDSQGRKVDFKVCRSLALTSFRSTLLNGSSEHDHMSDEQPG